MKVSSIIFHCRYDTSSFSWFVSSFPPTSILAWVDKHQLIPSFLEGEKTDRLTAFQITLPSIMGTTWVKLKPESTTIQHSGCGSFGRLNSGPKGMSEAAEFPYERHLLLKLEVAHLCSGSMIETHTPQRQTGRTRPGYSAG
jgi:hypothetical protein